MKKTFLLFLTIGFLFSCSADKPKNYKKMILGKWQFVEAKRDGQDAPTLQGIKYEFTENGKIFSNLGGTGLIGEYTYEISGDTIKQREGKQDIDFVITKVLTDSLFLSAQISKYDFEIVLERVKE